MTQAASSSMHGKVALVTGGTKGIGRASAEEMAKRGATVIVVGRSQDAGEATINAVRSEGGDAEFIAADLSSMSEVRRLAEIFKQRYTRLDVLIHSADVLRMKRQETPEGIEVSFATNYLSRFLLNNLLLDVLDAGAPARIVHVAAAGFPGKLDLSHIPPGPELSSFKGHNIGQRANDVFAIEWASRVVASRVALNVINPGMVDTDIRRSAPEAKQLMRVMELVFKPFSTTPQQFAKRVVYLATAPELAGVSGRLFGRKGKFIRTRPAVSDPRTGRRLWEISERLTGLGSSPAQATDRSTISQVLIAN